MGERLVLKEHQFLKWKPKYLRYNCWDISGESAPRVVDWSFNFSLAKPISKAPYLPPDHPVRKTVREHPELFQIVTPINIDAFRDYVYIHENYQFVDSVLDGLRFGFWPWAEIDKPGYPVTNDESRPSPKDPEKAKFLRDQRDIEIQKGRFSRAFGRELFPGMYAMPSFAVPKPNTKKFRLVTDQSAGDFSVNSLTHPHERSFPLDNMVHLGEILLRAHKKLPPGKHLILFKSDVSEAYRLLPMHPYWQIKQVNTIDGERYVDRNNAFGGKRSGDLFIAFMSLVLWIASHFHEIEDLCSYIDDVFSAMVSDEMELYEPYELLMPSRQTRLLKLWDELGIPHSKEKQFWGTCLTIIGFQVDAISLTITLPAQKKAELLEELDRFIIRQKSKARKKFYLGEFQRMGGWMNWAFNVFPLLRPSLNTLYAKTANLDPAKKFISLHMNRLISKDLEWGENHIKNLPGVLMLKELDWVIGDADLTVFCDASLVGLAFWIEKSNEGFHAQVPKNIPKEKNFFREALAVVSAIQHVAPRLSNQKLVIYSDNENTVNIFSSLGCRPEYNELLKFSIDLFIEHNIQFKVIHIPGELNQVADALSRNQFHVAKSLSNGIILSSFSPPPLPFKVYSPPQDSLGDSPC